MLTPSTVSPSPTIGTAGVGPAESRPGSRFGTTMLGLTRIALGLEFLWAFLDKTFGLGRATPSERAWLNGGSPTTGYLKGVTGAESENPFKGFFDIFVGHTWADWLFMAGLLGIGLALTLGVTMRIAAGAGALLLGLMWLASFPIATNPFIDEHLVLALLVLALAGIGAGRHLGLGSWWNGLGLVRTYRWLS